MKKRKLVRGGMFGHVVIELYRHEGEIVAWWWSSHESHLDVYDPLDDRYECGCCKCCGCDCWDDRNYEWEDDEE